MSNRSQAFKKKIKFQSMNGFQNKNTYINEKGTNDYSEYSILSNMFCSFLGLKKDDLERFLKDSVHDGTLNIFTNNFVIKDRKTYEKMMSSLSKAFKEGENKEYKRHLKEEDEAFKKGVKYGREQRENEMKNTFKNVSKNDLNNTEINKFYNEFNKTIQKCNEILSKFWL